MVILGHRGASKVAPENTLTAFRRALELGAAGFEFDVTLTRDGIPVIIHDDTLDRTCNGQGPVSAYTWEECRQFDAGGWKGPEFQGERLPTLEEVIALVQGMQPAPLLNIELKSKSYRTDGVEAAVYQVLRRANYFERLIVSSFNPFALMRMRQLAPALPRGLLYAPDLPLYLRRAWLRLLAQPQAMHPRHDMIDSSYMAWAKSKSLQVNTWTVDDPARARRLFDLGVYAVITNDVGRMVAEFGAPAGRVR